MIFAEDKRRTLHWAEAFGASAAVHLAAAVLVFDLLDGLVQFDKEATTEPEIEIITILDDDLRRITEQPESNAPLVENPVPAQPELPALATPPVDPGEIAPPDDPATEAELPVPVPADIAEQPVETLAANPVNDDVAEQAAGEVLAPLAPETTAISSPEVGTLRPLDEGGQTLSAADPAPATMPSLSPLRPEDGVAVVRAPTASQTITGTPLAEGETILSTNNLDSIAAVQGNAAAAAPTAPATVLSAAPPVSLTPRAPTALLPVQTIAPPRPAPLVAQAPTPDGQSAAGTVSALITRIRAQLDAPCLLAVPQQAGGTAPTLTLLGSNEAEMLRFADTVLTGLSPEPAQRRVLIDNRQCPALNFARENAFYPTFRLSVALNDTTLTGNATVAGAIGNTAGRYISLIVIDDNGVVQDLGPYLSFTGNAARFDVPARRDGPPRDTAIVLMALATATRPTALTTQNGQLAGDFFTSLRTEVGPNVGLVLVPFDLR